MAKKNWALKEKIVETLGSQVELSFRIGLNENTLSRIVNGRRAAKPEEAQRIAQALDCKTEELFPE